MKRVAFLSMAVVLLLLTVFSKQNAFANWYAGNNRGSTYGVKAQIYTPALEPDMVNSSISGQSSWVSISKPYWIQAGWRYWPEFHDSPRSYTESCRNPCTSGSDDHQLLDHGSLSWGTSKEYKVNHISGDTWCAYIDEQILHCRAQLNQPPEYGQAKTEIHGYSINEIDTFFTDVMYRTQGGNWYSFNYGNWTEMFPYGVYKYEYYRYETYRKDTTEVYLPLAIK